MERTELRIDVIFTQNNNRKFKLGPDIHKLSVLILNSLELFLYMLEHAHSYM